MNCYKEFNFGKGYYNSPFWGLYHKIEKVLGGNTANCAMWSNINRYDFKEGKPTGKIEQVISQLDFLLVKEIKDLNPDICIFLVGPSFDCRIEKMFPGVKWKIIAGWDQREFCKIEHDDLPPMSFRAYHPNYLRLKKLEDKFLSSLKRECGK